MTRPLVAYSSERREGMRTQIGSAHYSYVFIEDAIVGLLRALDYRLVAVSEPEMFKTPAAYTTLLSTAPADVTHIAFRSSENIRPMLGAWNICHFAWEFDVLREGGLATESVLADQVHMLRMVDEIWVGCAFTQAVLARYGIANTHVVSAPVTGAAAPERIPARDAMAQLAHVAAVPLVFAGALSRLDNIALAGGRIAPLPEMEALQRARDREGRVFLSILSPGDLRKNLLNIIDGFQLATAGSGRSDVLILKLAKPNRGDYQAAGLYDSLSPLCSNQMAKDDPRIIVIFDYLSEAQMTCLLGLADFYLCASHCEGFNLPLLQAMAHGVVPVTTRNTAMLDYITDDNAIVIAEAHVVSPIARMAADVARRLYSVPFASRFDVGRAVQVALRKTDAERRQIGVAAQGTVVQRYGAPEVSRVLAARLDPVARRATA